jgi:hypothetical protein
MQTRIAEITDGIYRLSTFVPKIAAVLLLAPPETPWAHEGWCRHVVRRALLGTKWTRFWDRADREARRLVARSRC